MLRMQIIQAIILGLTQGLTEFIPVSSSGHLILVGHLIHFQGSSLAFDTALDIGTLAALLIYFHRDFIELAVALVKKGEKTRLAWLLALATIPAVISGTLLESFVQTHRSNMLVGFNLALIALFMLWADHYGKRVHNLSKVTTPKAFRIGLAQALAVVPGVSRSGITISAGLFEGLDRVAATRFSFLLSAPIIAGAMVKASFSGAGLTQIGSEKGLVIAGSLAAAVSGWWAIRFMLKYLEHHSLSAFAYYRLAVGAIVFVMALVR